MSEFGKEIGNTLDKVLRHFKIENLCAETVIAEYSVKADVAKEILFALYRREYIRSVEHKDYKNSDEIALSDNFRIAVEGIDYIELHKRWWQRFWFKSVGCPIVISFVIALGAETVYHGLVNFVLSIVNHFK